MTNKKLVQTVKVLPFPSYSTARILHVIMFANVFFFSNTFFLLFVDREHVSFQCNAVVRHFSRVIHFLVYLFHICIPPPTLRNAPERPVRNTFVTHEATRVTCVHVSPFPPLLRLYLTSSVLVHFLSPISDVTS